MPPVIFTSALDINVRLTSRTGRFGSGGAGACTPVPRKVENTVEHTVVV